MGGFGRLPAEKLELLDLDPAAVNISIKTPTPFIGTESRS